MASVTDFSQGVDQYIKNAPTNLKNFQTGQQSQESDYLNRFRDVIAGQPTTSALASRIGDELGLPALRGAAQGLNQSLLDLPSVYSKATRGFDVNSNQLSRIIAQKQSEIAPYATAATTAQQNAEQQLATRLGYEQTDQAKQLMPYQTEQQMLSERLARESTGYTTMMQQEFEGYLEKMRQGVTLSEGEKNRANQLAVAEKAYQQAIKVAEINNANKAQYEAFPTGSSALYNVQTGQLKGWV